MKQFLYCFLFGMLFVVSNSYKYCKPYDPEPAQGLQIGKIQGTWYAVHFKPLKSTDLSSQVTGSVSFVSNFKFVDANTIEARNARRPRLNTDACITESIINKVTANPAVWRWQQVLRFGNRSVDFRILDTDYRNYIVRWTCGTESKYGKCVDFLVAVWGRKPAPFPPLIFDKVSKVVKDKLCLDINTFNKATHDRFCPLPPSQFGRKY